MDVLDHVLAARRDAGTLQDAYRVRQCDGDRSAVAETVVVDSESSEVRGDDAGGPGRGSAVQEEATVRRKPDGAVCASRLRDFADPVTRARGPGAPLTDDAMTWLTTPDVCRQATNTSSSATMVCVRSSA